MNLFSTSSSSTNVENYSLLSMPVSCPLDSDVSADEDSSDIEQIDYSSICNSDHEEIEQNINDLLNTAGLPDRGEKLPLPGNVTPW